MAPQTCCCGRLSLRGGSIAAGAVLTVTSGLAVAVSLAMLLCLKLGGAPWLPVAQQTAGSLLTTSAPHLLFSVVLLRGALSSRHLLLLTWLVFAATAVILQAIGLVVAAALMCVQGATPAGCVALAVGTAWTSLLSYCLLVVLDHSLELNMMLNKQLSGTAAAKDNQVVLVYQVQTV